MKTIKVSEAQGQVLDWLVAKLEEACDRCLTIVVPSNTIGQFVWREVEYDSAPNFEWWAPSRIWSQGGPIIERERISVSATSMGPGFEWEAHCIPAEGVDYYGYGSTPLIAAMRCYVTSKLGDTAEVPEELA